MIGQYPFENIYNIDFVLVQLEESIYHYVDSEQLFQNHMVWIFISFKGGNSELLRSVCMLN